MFESSPIDTEIQSQIHGPGAQNDTRARVELIKPECASRAEIEAFISDCFKRSYGASLYEFMPQIMCVRDPSCNPVAALGYRHAINNKLFLEQYFDEPIESVMHHMNDIKTTRQNIVEVGNLAATQLGGARLLIFMLTAYLRGAKQEWTLFTATPSLRNSFRRIGVNLHILGEADPGRLPNTERERWGSYYKDRPVVAVANVQQAFTALSNYLNSNWSVNDLANLFQDAYHVGRGENEFFSTPSANTG